MKRKFELHLAAFIISCFFASCSFESVRTDANPDINPKNIGVDTLNPGQLTTPMDSLNKPVTTAASTPTADTSKGSIADSTSKGAKPQKAKAKAKK